MEIAPYVPLIGQIALCASLALTVILGLMLTFHWFKYSMNPVVATSTVAIYFIVAGFLIAGMISALPLSLAAV